MACSISKCKDPKWKTDPKLSSYNCFHSPVTGSKGNIFNPAKSRANYKSNNSIYLLTRENRGLQYLGKTTFTLNKCMNIHCTSKNGASTLCPNLTNVVRKVHFLFK